MKIKLDTIEHAMIVNAARNTKFTQQQIRAKLESIYAANFEEDIKSALEDLEELEEGAPNAL